MTRDDLPENTRNAGRAPAGPAKRVTGGRDMTDTRPIVVLGAGINGAALARELVLSGASVIVVDEGDVARGATAWSTRLIHGGLRYLEYGDLSLVRESLAERDRLVRLAPHLVRPLSFYLPVRRRFGGLLAAAARAVGLDVPSVERGSLVVGLGLTLYDALATGSRWPRHRMVRAGAAGLPAIDATAFPVAGVYADAQLRFPERFTVELLVDARRIAAEQGVSFAVLTHRRSRLVSDGTLLVESASGGGERLTFVPRAVVNATGAWVDRTLDEVFVASRPAAGPLIGGTKGSHLVIRSAPLLAALAGHGVYAEAEDGRPVFVLPFGDELVLVGTTDLPFAGDPAMARADDGEIAYLLAACGRLFPSVAPARADVQQHYCGVRPLPARRRGTPAAATRRHAIVRHPDAPVPTWSIVGGKLTTCRSLAESTAATVLPGIGVAVRGDSRERPLPGAWPAPSEAGARETAAAAVRAGFTAEEAECTASRAAAIFGARAPAVFGRPGAAPGTIRGSGLPLSAVEFCVREEWAATVADVVERRLMLSFDPATVAETIDDVAAELARLGVIPAARVTAEAEACRRGLEEHHGRRLGRIPVTLPTAGHQEEEMRS